MLNLRDSEPFQVQFIVVVVVVVVVVVECAYEHLSRFWRFADRASQYIYLSN